MESKVEFIAEGNRPQKFDVTVYQCQEGDGLSFLFKELYEPVDIIPQVDSFKLSFVKELKSRIKYIRERLDSSSQNIEVQEAALQVLGETPYYASNKLT